MKNISNKTKLLVVSKYLLFFCLFYVMFKANINNIVFPFSIGIFFALIWCNQNVIGLSLGFTLASYLSDFSLYTLLSSVIFCALFACIYFIHYKLKKPLKYLHILIYACICYAPKLFIQLYFLDINIYVAVVEFVLALLFMFGCIKFFEALCVRGICGRFTSIELICAFVFAVAISSGLCQIEIFEISILKFFGLLCLLIFCYTTNFTTILLLSLALGIGNLIATNGLEYLVLFAIYGLTLCVFKTKNKSPTITKYQTYLSQQMEVFLNKLEKKSNTIINTTKTLNIFLNVISFGKLKIINLEDLENNEINKEGE